MSELTRQELREVQLSILDRIDSFCRHLGITYHLAFGTLLGAIRDGSYIPWDDDIDLTMPRADYKRFCAAFPALHPELHLGAPSTTREWAYPHTKISDRRTVLTEDTELEHHLGVNVDIFPLDYPANSFLGARAQLIEVRLLKGLLTLKGLTPRDARAGCKAVLIRLSKPVVRRISTGQLTRRIDRAAAKNPEARDRVCMFVGPRIWQVSAAAIAGSTFIEFEARTAPAPSGHHEVLTAIYGANYLQPPPEADRLTHHRFTARWAD
jgi:phosphorylcholine metabolism protein LicD